jgi:ATP-binding protein involved in chromosome partitioning
MDKVSQLIAEVINPASGKTLSSENRFKKIVEENGILTVEYNREGISPQQKREIENSIFNVVSEFYPQDKVLVKSFSENSKDIYQSVGQKTQSEASGNQANLKVGHATPMPKKRVQGVGQVIGVTSCKGGVGKSTVAVNLALSLKNMGKKVGLLDADIYGPSLPILMGERMAKPQASEAKKILPLEKFGIKFISFGLFVGEKEPVIWRGPMLGGVLNQFLFDTDWGELDYLIIDLPPGTGDVQLSLVQNTELDGAIVVSTPQKVALLDTVKGLNMFTKVNIPILGVVENMSYFAPDDDLNKKYFVFGEGGVKEVAEEHKLPFLGEIPLEIALREGSDNGTPYMSDSGHEGRPVWKGFMSLAKSILEEEKNEETKKGFFGRIFS